MAGPARVALILASAALLAGCQPRAPNDPVVSAVALNDTGTVGDYLAQGGDPELTTREGDPLLYVASGPRGGVGVARLLLDAGADPDTVSGDGRTALQNAASWCDVDMVRLLVSAGASVKKAGRDGRLPLDSVCSTPEDRRLQVIAILQGAGAPGG